MKQKSVNIKYDLVKYKALEYYLSKTNKTLEEEMHKFLESFYDEQVPEQVREYIKSQNTETESQTQQEQSTARTTPRRRTNSNRVEQASSEEHSEIEPTLTM